MLIGGARRGAGPITHDRGSVLMLMPAAVLVMVVLAAIVVDLAILRMRDRELHDAATAAANDAAAHLADPHLYGEGVAHVDPADARGAVIASLRARDLDGLEISQVRLEGPVVVVELRRTVEHLFGAALPGTPGDVVLEERARATILVDPAD